MGWASRANPYSWENRDGLGRAVGIAALVARAKNRAKEKRESKEAAARKYKASVVRRGITQGVRKKG